MNTQKYKLHNSNLLKENDRTLYQKQRENGEVCFDSQSKSRIDFSRTHLNYNLCPHEPYTKEQLIKIHEDTRGKRFPRNGVLFGSTVITLPKDYNGDSRTFFETAYNGLLHIYGLEDADVVSAFVHMDETSPHMHFNFIPRYQNTISWEKMMPKSMYESQHNRLEDYMNSQNIGMVHLLNGETLGFDVQQLTQEQKSISMEIYSLKSERDTVYEEIFKNENKKNKLLKDIDFYFGKGDVESAEKCTSEWELCSIELSKLSERKKKIAKELEEKFVELNDNQKPTSNQRQIFELIADKTELENQCYNATFEILESRKEIDSLKEEITEKQNNIAIIKRDFVNFKADLKVQFTELLADFKSAFKQAKTELEKNILMQRFESKIKQIEQSFNNNFETMEQETDFDFER